MAAIPPDFADALNKSGVTEYFSRLAPSHQKEYLKWIGEAKRTETRSARLGKAVQMILVKSCFQKSAQEKSRAK